MSINTLKAIALLCMTVDHIGAFFPAAPIWFRWIGRLAAPLFFYCSAWGFYYTGNRKKYLIRLYLLGIIMSAGNIAVFLAAGKKSLMSSDIFVTLFLGCMTVSLLERAVRNKEERIRLLLLSAVWQAGAFLLCVIFAEFLQIPGSVGIYMLYYFYGALFGSAVFAAVYFLKEKKGAFTVFCILFSIILELAVRRTYYMRGPAAYLVPFNGFQWMMVFAVPFIWMYNGRKGKGSKRFYYFFYPLHIWILYLAGNL